MGVVGRLDQYASMLATEFDETTANNPSITGLGTYYSSGFDENTSITTLVQTGENLFERSEEIDNTYWNKSNLSGTITANQTTAPDGNLTADLYQEDATTTGRYVSKGMSVTSGTIYTVSIWAKQAPGSTRYLGLILPSVGFGVNVIVSFTLSGVGSRNISVSGTATSAEIQAYPDGWYRCYLASQATATASGGIQIRLSNSSTSGNASYAGDGTSGIYLWGAQFERSSAPTDYIPTTTTSLTRSLPSPILSLSANVFPPYDLVYDEFSGTLFGAGQGRYMRQNTDKSVIVYNEIDEIGLTPSYVISPSTTSVNEGSSVIFSVTATNVENGTTLYYDITGSVGIASTDFTNSSLSGSLSVSGTFDLGYGSTTLTLLNDTFTEGTETFKMNVRTGSISGTIVGISPIITILDTSLDPELFAFTSFTFTNGTATGSSGPTSFASDSTYTTSTWYSSYFSVASGIQSWTVPANGTYRINAVGASGGENNGGTFFPGRPGQGATIQGDFVLTKGTVLNLVVGQKGVYGSNGSGGGGGSFVYTGSIGGAGLLIAAGGGGGWGHGTASYPNGAYGGGGSSTTSTVSGIANPSPPDAGSKGTGEGGFGGSVGNASGSGGGGAGWLSSGNNSAAGTGAGGTRFVGATTNGVGGFGGGGSSGGNGQGGGGGGGYSGGGGATGWNTISWGAGAGAGSYNSGTNQTNTAGTTGQSSGWTHGSIIITKL